MKIQHEKYNTKIKHGKYDMKIQHRNTTHIFYNIHTTQTGLYNTGNITHHTTCIQHGKYNTEKYNKKKSFVF